MDVLKRATRADVARHARVSETIVSYVLNNNRYVRQDKRNRVLEAVQELGYQPNPIARSLKGKKSNHIAFIADQIANEHFGQLIAEMDLQAYDRGYLISLCANHNDPSFVAQMVNRQFDGVVISSISFSERAIEQLLVAGIPVVLLMNREYHLAHAKLGRIYTGLYQGARECVRHLERQGRRNILYIDRFSRHRNFSDLNDLRYQGFVHQMQESGLTLTQQNIITGCASEDEVHARIIQRVREGFPVDAVFGRNDRLAVLGMSALQSIGISVPGDVSVIGFDNSSLSRYITPKLTTMQIDRTGIAQTAIEMLHALIDGEAVEDRHFDTKLMQRESV